MDTISADALTLEDVGNAAGEGSMEERGDQIRITGSGEGLGRNADSFTYGYQQATGDFEMMVRLDEFAGAGVHSRNGTGPQAGIIIRENLEPGARSVMLMAQPNGKARLLVRTATEDDARPVAEPHDVIPLPIWIKLQRRGTSFEAWAMENGLRWGHFGSTDVDLSDTLYVGLAVAPAGGGEPVTAAFSEVAIHG